MSPTTGVRLTSGLMFARENLRKEEFYLFALQ